MKIQGKMHITESVLMMFTKNYQN